MKWKAAAVFMMAAGLFAQAPAGKAARGAGERGARGMEALKASIGLTDAQAQQLRELRKQQVEAVRPGLQQIREKRQALAEAMRGDNPDPVQVGRLMVEEKKLRQTIREGQTGYREKAQAVLTPEQKTKLQELQQAGRRAGAVRQARAAGLLELPERAERGAARGRAPLRGRRW